MEIDVRIEESWREVLQEEFEKGYFVKLVNFVKDEYRTNTIYPPGSEIFRAFDRCKFSDTRVVIIGQDPYHGEKQANGLCFSVRDEVRVPPSLQNIYKELKTDVGKEIPLSGDLESWAGQGVLMLNAILTVKAKSPGSHRDKGWEIFTDAVIRILSEEKESLVFFLWGAYAQKKGAVIDRAKHLVLASPHPSPFSAHTGFFGCKHFSKANEYLEEQGGSPIEW